jgi:hypothetical protein
VLPQFDESARLTFKQRLGFSYIRLGEGAKAEQTFHDLIAAFTRVVGADSPHVLRVRLNLAQACSVKLIAKPWHNFRAIRIGARA